MKKIIFLFSSKIVSSFYNLIRSTRELFLSRYGDNKYVKGILLVFTYLKGTYIYRMIKIIMKIIAWVNILLGVGILTMYTDIGTFHIAYVNIYQDLYLYLYKSYQNTLKWIINQLFNHLDNLDNINLDKIKNLELQKMNAEIAEMNQIKNVESNIQKMIYNQENIITDPSSNIKYYVLGGTIIIVMVVMGYIYIDDIKLLVPKIGTRVSESASYLHHKISLYFFGDSNVIDPKDMTPKLPEASLPDINHEDLSLENSNLDSSNGYFE